LLKRLCKLNGTSGYENGVIKFIEDTLNKNSIKYIKDKLGNITVRYGKTPDSIALFAHIDEVGFAVRGITKDGMLKFTPVGGVIPEILPASTVVVGTEKEKINGVIGNVPKHLKAKTEQEKQPMAVADDMFIDIGAKSKKDALKYVKIGDPVYFGGEYVEFGDSLIKSKALDDRAGVAVILNILLKKRYSFTACFTTREEIGLVGAKIASKNLSAKLCLILEVTTCADMPRGGQPSTKLGDGPALTVMDGGSVSDLSFNALITMIANKNIIPIQKKLTLRGSNDAAAVSFYSGGTRTAVLSLPGRYLHTPVCVISKEDYNSLLELTEKILDEVCEDYTL
jgi:endoglucanase